MVSRVEGLALTRGLDSGKKVVKAANEIVAPPEHHLDALHHIRRFYPV